MLNIKSKLPSVGETIFTVMSSLANQHQAINLGQGFPDFPMSTELNDLVSKAMKDGNNQYTHMNGYPVLREVLAEKINFLYNNKVNAEKEITVTPGGTYALYTAMTAILQPGDEVVVFEPAYDCYIPQIELNGAIPVLIPLQYPDYKIDWEEVKKRTTANTRMIIINTPHNPTGSVLSKQDIDKLSEIVKDTKIIILSDEVYEHLIFDGKTHESILKYPPLFERSIVCFSFGKVFHCTGWKLGYAVSPASLMTEFRKIHQFNAFTCNTPMQYAIAEYLQKKEAYLELGAFMENKRDFFQGLMSQTKFTPLPSHGSYFQIYSYENITDLHDKDFAIKLTKENKVTTIPVSAFYNNQADNKVLRFCFAKSEKTIKEAVSRLINL
ncbi:MAG: pyridoxal phosphate-dependent aminotransferase [Ginsengibacter sp.]